MSDHQASEQMLGYLYQVRYALALLLSNDNLDCQISIETVSYTHLGDGCAADAGYIPRDQYFPRR